METRFQAVIGAIIWAMTVVIPAAQKIPGLPAGTQLNPGRVSPGGGNYIVIGCVSRELQGTSEIFVVTDSRPKPPAQYQLDGDADLFRLHVGRTVEISGTVTPAAAGAKSVPTLKAQSLVYISPTCIKLK